MGRRLFAFCLSVLLFAVPVAAADDVLPLAAAAAAHAADAAVAADRAEAAAPAEAPAPFAAPAWTPARRPLALPALYAGSAALQAFDAYSTLKALHLGAREANPFMQGAVGNPAVLIGVKAAVTTASIVAAEQMWRQHHQMRAIALMAISNGVMAAVAAHNASAISSLPR